jgi:polysaccharide deacetylase family protein (PEP-CTERM system associated)
VTNILTVDLEDWFHVCGVDALSREHWSSLPSRVDATTRWLLDALDAAGIRATFFVLGWIAEQHPRLVAAVSAAGHEIGSHGHDHLRAYDLAPEIFRGDLRRSVAALEGIGVPKVTAFRAPEWSINDRSLWALDVLSREGFEIDASMAPVRLVGSPAFPRHPHVRKTASGEITEIPPLVADRFGNAMPLGWGWGLRMSSPRTVLRRVEEVNRMGVPAVLTVHPWELDVDPPHVKLPATLHFAHYFRLEGFRNRLRSILDGARFGPIGSRK